MAALLETVRRRTDAMRTVLSPSNVAYLGYIAVAHADRISRFTISSLTNSVAEVSPVTSRHHSCYVTYAMVLRAVQYFSKRDELGWCGGVLRRTGARIIRNRCDAVRQRQD